MKVLLTCPNRQFAVGNETVRPIVEELTAIGFTFRVRAVPGGELAYADGPITVEMQTLEELVALQRRIGLPIRLEDGVLEITS